MLRVILLCLALLAPTITAFHLPAFRFTGSRALIPEFATVRNRNSLTSLKCVSTHDLVSRRNAVNGLLVQIAAISFARSAHSDSLIIKAPEGRPRNIIITGANSGIFV